MPTTTIRSSNILSSSTSSTTLALPTGTVVGDLVLLFVGAAFNVDPPTPAGWTSFASGGPPITWNGNSFYKVMVASDITTGSVTVPFEGGFQNVVGMVTFVGNPVIRTSAVLRAVPEGTPDTLSTPVSTPTTGDIVIYFASNRGSSTDTVNRGTQIQTTTQTNGSGSIYSETLASSGTVTANFTYSPSGSGAYDVIAVLVGTTTTQQVSVSKTNAYAALSDNAGTNVSKVNAYTAITPPLNVYVSKANVYAALSWVGVSTTKTNTYAAVALVTNTAFPSSSGSGVQGSGQKGVMVI